MMSSTDSGVLPLKTLRYVMTASSAADTGSAAENVTNVANTPNAASARQDTIAIRGNDFIWIFTGPRQRGQAAANCGAPSFERIAVRPAIARRCRSVVAIARIECDRERRRARRRRPTAEEFL